jgi:hypothetical protein
VSENLDLVRSIYADWERGDFSSVVWANPNIAFVTTDRVSGAATHRHGLAQMAQETREMFTTLEAMWIAATEYRDLDPQHVFVLDRMSAIGKKSGIAIAIDSARLFQIFNGKVTKIVHYATHDSAMADLGLEE